MQTPPSAKPASPLLSSSYSLPPLSSLLSPHTSSTRPTTGPNSKHHPISLSIHCSQPPLITYPLHKRTEPNVVEKTLDRYSMKLVAGMDPCVSCTTFNILAPIYKRVDKEDQSRRESHHRAYWLARNQSILDRLLAEKSSIICLQEFWVGNGELVQMYEKRLRDAGYISFKLARTNNRGDGLFTAVHKEYFRVLAHRELHFNDFGDKVAQVLHVQSVSSTSKDENSKIQRQVIIVNTHLLFPHNYSYCTIRLRQVYKILQYVESYREEKKLGCVPVILCGDWNGSKRGQVYKFLRSQGFVSSYDTAHRYMDGKMDAHKWVSHRNHRGNVVGVDFIWLLNPNKHQKPLRTSWNEAIFCIIKHTLRKASLTEAEAFALFKGGNAGDYISYSSFCQALSQLGLSDQPHRLSAEDVEHLWTQADVDKDGILDYLDFQRTIWNPRLMGDLEEGLDVEGPAESNSNVAGATIGFDVKKAALFPPEVEKGTWPEDYSLSDHAPLTVVLCPKSMPCSRPIY